MLGGKVPESYWNLPRATLRRLGPANKDHIWFGYRSILAGPKGADRGQLYVTNSVFSSNGSVLSAVFDLLQFFSFATCSLN